MGEERARTYLNAHENLDSDKPYSGKPTEPIGSTEMDLYNNEKGIDFVLEKNKNGQDPTESEIENAGLDKIRNEELVVKTPTTKI